MTDWNMTMAEGALLYLLTDEINRAGRLPEVVKFMPIQLCQFLAAQPIPMGCAGGPVRKLYDLAVAKAKVQP